ncbi:MAG: copper chaperone PCu(A)C [Rhodanobacteraceae bacterium]
MMCSARVLAILLAALLGIGASIPPAAASAGDVSDSASLKISDAWVRWLPGDLPSAAYASLTNRGATRMRLTGASSPDYASIMLHRSVVKDGVSRMEPVAGIDIDAGATVTLAPGGYHLMLMEARHAIVPGDVIHLKLDFADGATREVVLPVKPANATGAN